MHPKITDRPSKRGTLDDHVRYAPDNSRQTGESKTIKTAKKFVDQDWKKNHGMHMAEREDQHAQKGVRKLQQTARSSLAGFLIYSHCLFFRKIASNGYSRLVCINLPLFAQET
jgi:hypothetical protein